MRSVPEAVATGSVIHPVAIAPVLTSLAARETLIELICLWRDNQSVPLTITSALEEGTMLVNWIKDADAALEQAKTENKLVLIDFSAAPA